MQDPQHSELERSRQLALTLAMIEHCARVETALASAFVPRIRRASLNLKSGTAMARIETGKMLAMIAVMSGMPRPKRAEALNG